MNSDLTRNVEEAVLVAHEPRLPTEQYVSGLRGNFTPTTEYQLGITYLSEEVTVAKSGISKHKDNCFAMMEISTGK